jgi:hypothetical protein
VAEGAGLENQSRCKATAGSNPAPTANHKKMSSAPEAHPPLAGNPTASAIKTRNKRENNSGLYEPLLFFIFFVLSIFN